MTFEHMRPWPIVTHLELGTLTKQSNQLETSKLAMVWQCSSGTTTDFLANKLGAAIPLFLCNTQFCNLCSSLDKGMLTLSANKQFCVCSVNG